MVLLITIALLLAAVLFWLLRCAPYMRERSDAEEHIYQSELKKRDDSDRDN